MATPTATVYAGASGATVYGGRSLPIPAWVPALGTVADVSLNTPQQGLGPANSSTATAFGRSWTGRAYAKWWGTYGRTVGGAGGHGDGAQNWLLGYDIEARRYYVEKPSCTVFHCAIHTYPSGTTIDDFDYVGDPLTGWMYGDTIASTANLQIGEPFTSHFYAMQVCVPPSARNGGQNGWLVTPTRGSLAEGGQHGTFQGHRFALGQATKWELHSTPHATRNEHAPSLYDSVRNRVVFASDWPAGVLGWTNIADETKGQLSLSSSMEGYYFVGAHHLAQDFYMFITNYTGVPNSTESAGLNLTVVNPSNGTKTRVSATGTAPPLTEQGAWAWAEEWNAWGYYPGLGGNDFYLLKCTGDPSGNNWVWSKQTVTGTARTRFVDSNNGGLPLTRLSFIAALGTFLWEADYNVPAQMFCVSQP